MFAQSHTLRQPVDLEWLTVATVVLVLILFICLRELRTMRGFRPPPWVGFVFGLISGSALIFLLVSNDHGTIAFPPFFAFTWYFILCSFMFVGVLVVERYRHVRVYVDSRGLLFHAKAEP
jgi:xanthine/uracil permease